MAYQRADIALAQDTNLSRVGIVELAKLKLGHGNRAILPVALDITVIGKALAQDRKSCGDDFAMLALQRRGESHSDGIKAPWGVLDSVYKIMGVFARAALIDGECL